MGSRICGQDKDTSREEPEEQKPEEHKIIVFNTQGYEREDTVTVSGVARGEAAYACDCLGYRAPVQYVGEDTLIFHAKGIPSCGYAVYSLCSPQNTPGLTRNHPDLTQNARAHGPASLKMTGTGLRLMIRWSLFPWLKRRQAASC